MRSAKQFLAILICALLFLPAVPAQTTRQDAQSAAIAQEVTIIIQHEQVRFTAQKAVAEMRLQIFNQSGELVYDSGAVTEPQINWPLQQASGEALRSGMYAYSLSIKEAGAEAARVRRGHFIVDRAKERDGNTDRLWVTSQNDSSIGTDLTVARSEDATVAGLSSSRERAGEKGDGSKRDDGSRKVEKEKKDGKKSREDALEVAGAGTPGQLAKFISPEEVGDSGVTEVVTDAGSLVGIGTQIPVTTLDVRGHLTLDAGGSPVLYTAAGGGEQNRYLQLINSPEAPSASGIKAGGVLVSDSYAFANPGKNDLVVKGTAGFGTASPSSSRVTIEGQDALTARGYEPFINLQDSNDFFFQSGHRIQSAHGDLNFFHGYYQQSGGIFATRKYVYVPRMVIKDSGNVGIGTAYPNHQLSLGRGPTWTRNGWGGAMELENASAIAWKANAAGQRFGIGHTNGGLYFFRTTSDPATTTAPANYDLSISDAGEVSVRMLRINGADFAENFDVNVAPTTDEEEAAPEVEPGMVVSIDPTDPGKLALSNHAYDRRVAGIISGAGGVRAGMRMGQEGTLADGKHPVALSGRVYCKVDASQGAIEPGDLLTTSDTPGHAMKVTDQAKAQGAIIGKAMTGLKEGRGMVLVLVTLQ
ncbi:MAG TPA: hypothetical protein VFD58_16640 [Blastocatellia bacterium]|nr:hypothetical protein [Blastocatellia bacterium]